jgi:8-oxo-dGTP diphosphatase
VELGESLEEAVVREMAEETGLTVVPGPLLTVFDRIERRGGEVLRHDVILDYLCDWRGGEARAGSDAAEVAWATAEELPAYDLPPKAREVAAEAFRRAASAPERPSPPLPHPPVQE